jgi:hypothetical protein
MHVIKVRHVVVGALVLMLTAVAADSSFAQTPGAPQATVLPDNSVIISYAAPVTPPQGSLLVATLNGAPIGPFAIGTSTTISSGGPVPSGVYQIQIVWGNGAASPVSTFVVGSGSGPALTPGGTVMHPAVVSGNTVTLTWDPIPDVSSYELEAILFESGQRFSMSVGGNQTSLVVPNVSFGNYTVRVRGRNALGAGAFSNGVLISIGASVRLRDMEVTLTWNTQADLDLHIIEPSGTHVSWQRRRGVTSRLEADNTIGFGPETAVVDVLGAARGVYQIFIVHYAGAFPTTATVAVTLNAGSANATTQLFTRQTPAPDSTRGYNVALVDVRSGVIGETFGTRSVPAPDVRFGKVQSPEKAQEQEQQEQQ